jgi:hypothetical protein
MNYKDSLKAVAMGIWSMMTAFYIVGVVIELLGLALDSKKTGELGIVFWVVGVAMLLAYLIAMFILPKLIKSSDSTDAIRTLLEKAGYRLEDNDVFVLYADKDDEYEFFVACGEGQNSLTVAEAEDQWHVYQDLWNGERLLIPPEELQRYRAQLSARSDAFVVRLREIAAQPAEADGPSSLWSAK